jgi:hypothetical protein
MNPIDDSTRLQIMRLLADNPELTQRELADALGISLGLNPLLPARADPHGSGEGGELSAELEPAPVRLLSHADRV